MPGLKELSTIECKGSVPDIMTLCHNDSVGLEAQYNKHMLEISGTTAIQIGVSRDNPRIR
jgi:hypothetical protein